MLTKEDFYHNLRILNLACKIGIFPLELDSRNGQMQLLQRKRKMAACYGYLALFTIHTTYIVVRLPYLILGGAQLPILSLLVHFTMLCGFMAILFWHFTAFFRYTGISATCFNKALETWGLVSTGSQTMLKQNIKS